MRDLVILLLVIGFAAAVVVLKWNEFPMQAWVTSETMKFDQLHPVVTAVL